MDKVKQKSCCAKVLIVNNDNFQQFAHKKIFLQHGHMTEDAFDGQQAIEKIKTRIEHPCLECKSNKFNVMIIKAFLPIKDGIQTVREIKQMVNEGVIQNIFCVIKSPLSDAALKQRAFEVGTDCYITSFVDSVFINTILKNILQ